MMSCLIHQVPLAKVVSLMQVELFARPEPRKGTALDGNIAKKLGDFPLVL